MKSCTLDGLLRKPTFENPCMVGCLLGAPGFRVGVWRGNMLEADYQRVFSWLLLRRMQTHPRTTMVSEAPAS